MGDQRWTWDWEGTDRQRWPSTWGRITVLAPTEADGFKYAHDTIFASARVAMVTRLDLVDWEEPP